MIKSICKYKNKELPLGNSSILNDMINVISKYDINYKTN